jgi:hypothetical protein
MSSLDFGRCALSSCMAAALLAGCGGSQPPIGTPGAMPQSSANATHAAHGGSWMKPAATTGDLLYVSAGVAGVVYVLSYPQGNMEGALTGFQFAQGLCSDKSGDVFVVDSAAQTIIEYAHGGSSPIATLNDSGNHPQGCAVDPQSGNLAAAGGYPYQNANIAVFVDAKDPPTVYSTGFFNEFFWCTYDDKGNVIASVGGDINGGALMELPKGGNTLIGLNVDRPFESGAPLQWRGKYFALSDFNLDSRGPTKIYQVQFSGSTGSVVKTIDLYTSPKGGRNPAFGYQFWIQGNRILSVKTPNTFGRRNVGLWRYPVGGLIIKSFRAEDPYGITVSLAPR